jgi:hypothetical protein
MGGMVMSMAARSGWLAVAMLLLGCGGPGGAGPIPLPGLCDGGACSDVPVMMSDGLAVPVVDGPGFDAVGPGQDRPLAPDGEDDGGTCGGESVAILPTVTPNVMMVLDQSGSMASAFGDATPFPSSRLAALESAVRAVLDDEQLAGKIRWGLSAYPTTDSDQDAWNTCSSACADTDRACKQQCQIQFGGCTVEADPIVTPSDTSTGTVRSRIMSLTSQGSTPTAEALEAARMTLPALTTREHPSYVLLGTDGDPNCHDDDTGARSVAAAQALRDLGIRTFVVGIAFDQGSADILDRIAEAGGTARSAPTSYYDAQDPASLSAAFAEIAGIVADCSISLMTTPPDPRLLGVALDGTFLPRDDPDGFTYGVDAAGNATVTLNGAACQRVQSGQGAQLDVRYGCRFNG